MGFKVSIEFSHRPTTDGKELLETFKRLLFFLHIVVMVLCVHTVQGSSN